MNRNSIEISEHPNWFDSNNNEIGSLNFRALTRIQERVLEAGRQGELGSVKD